MRRKDKEISDTSRIDAIIKKATVCRLGSEKQFEFPENKLKATTVIKVKIENMTGKQSGL